MLQKSTPASFQTIKEEEESLMLWHTFLWAWCLGPVLSWLSPSVAYPHFSSKEQEQISDLVEPPPPPQKPEFLLKSVTLYKNEDANVVAWSQDPSDGDEEQAKLVCFNEKSNRRTYLEMLALDICQRQGHATYSSFSQNTIKRIFRDHDGIVSGQVKCNQTEDFSIDCQLTPEVDDGYCFLMDVECGACQRRNSSPSRGWNKLDLRSPGYPFFRPGLLCNEDIVNDFFFLDQDITINITDLSLGSDNTSSLRPYLEILAGNEEESLEQVVFLTGQLSSPMSLTIPRAEIVRFKYFSGLSQKYEGPEEMRGYRAILRYNSDHEAIDWYLKKTNGMIVGIVVGSIVGVCLLCALCNCIETCVQKKKSKRRRSGMTTVHNPSVDVINFALSRVEEIQS